MQKVLKEIQDSFKKKGVVDVRSGDTVRVHQKIKEGEKERIQVFEGLVIKTRRKKSSTSSITVRRLSSGVGVERTFQVHSPLVVKLEVTKRSNVRRNYLSYMRDRSGKSARLANVVSDFDEINAVQDEEAEKVAEPVDEVAEEKLEEKPAAEETPKEDVKPEAKKEEDSK